VSAHEFKPDYDVLDAMSPDWDAWDGRHDAVKRQKRLFQYDHLPEHLQRVSRPFAVLATNMLRQCPDVPELTNALHRIWEAKNLVVVAVARPE
jgi:hypothetical protein